MNYQQHIKRTYQLQANNNNKSVVAYFRDGSYAQCPLDVTSVIDVTIEELEYKVANYCNRELTEQTTLELVGFSYSENSDIYFVSTNKVDFLQVSSFNSGFEVSAVTDLNLNSTIDDYSGIENYITDTAYGSFSSGTNINTYNFSVSPNYNVVFDYSNLYFENGDYKTEYRAIRGENVGFYYTYLYIEGYDVDNVYVSYGSPYLDAAKEAEAAGYSRGYASGNVEGYNNGFQDGQNAVVDYNSYNALGYIGTAFSVINNVLEIEVLPHVTLGLCFSIPLVFVLITTLFKLVKK